MIIILGQNYRGHLYNQLIMFLPGSDATELLSEAEPGWEMIIHSLYNHLDQLRDIFGC